MMKRTRKTSVVIDAWMCFVSWPRASVGDVVQRFPCVLGVRFMAYAHPFLVVIRF